MKRKISFLLAVIIMIVCCAAPVQAAENLEQQSTVLVLEVNSITDVGNRHIKVTWDVVPGANNYQLQIADNEYFNNSVEKLSRNRTYWNYAEVPGNVNDTYYVRVRPRFVNDDPAGEKYLYGKWSNVVTAEYIKNTVPNPIYPENLKNIDWFPWIPKGIDWKKLLSIDWSKVIITR